jgi:hypothetical protein
MLALTLGMGGYIAKLRKAYGRRECRMITNLLNFG